MVGQVVMGTLLAEMVREVSLRRELMKPKPK